MMSLRFKGWYLQGKYFGYPNCCIKAFLLGEQSQDSVFSGTAFLPCSECNKKNPLEIVDVINTNRVCPDKFELKVSVVVFNSTEWDSRAALADKLWKASETMRL